MSELTTRLRKMLEGCDPRDQGDVLTLCDSLEAAERGLASEPFRLLGAARAEVEALRAEVERLSRLYRCAHQITLDRQAQWEEGMRRGDCAESAVAGTREQLRKLEPLLDAAIQTRNELGEKYLAEQVECEKLKAQLDLANAKVQELQAALSGERSLGQSHEAQWMRKLREVEAQLAETQKESERLKQGWKQADLDLRSHFDQSCHNLRRAEVAEAQLAALREALKDIRDYSSNMGPRSTVFLLQQTARAALASPTQAECQHGNRIYPPGSVYACPRCSAARPAKKEIGEEGGFPHHICRHGKAERTCPVCFGPPQTPATAAPSEPGCLCAVGWRHCPIHQDEGRAGSGPSEPTYPCDNCGKLRTKAEGGTTFTVCDECWDKYHHEGEGVADERSRQAPGARTPDHSGSPTRRPVRAEWGRVSPRRVATLLS